MIMVGEVEALVFQELVRANFDIISSTKIKFFFTTHPQIHSDDEKPENERSPGVNF